MTDFKAIFGKKIKFQTTDLTMSTATEGELFYSDTDKEFKVGVTVAAWAAGGNVTTARAAGVGMGTQTAGLFATGYTGGNVNNSEEYDGSSWTEGDNVGTARRAVTCHGFGTQTAGGFAGGYVSGAVGNTELYDGSSWTEAGDLGTAVYDAGQFGTQTAAVSVGGGPIPDSRVTNEWDGSSWSGGGSMTVRRQQPLAVGTLTAGLAATGHDPSVPGAVSATEEYNGTAWATSPGTVNTARISVGGSGIQTAALAFGGLNPDGSTTSVGATAESYDGTNWTNTSSLATARGNAGSSGAGTSKLALFFGGGPTSSVLNATEEFTQTISLKTVTDS